MGKCVDNNRCPIPEKGQRWVAWDRPMIISKQKQKKGNTRSLYRRIVCWYRIIKSCLALQSNSKTPKFCQGAKPRKGYYTKTNRECGPGGGLPYLDEGARRSFSRVYNLAAVWVSLTNLVPRAFPAPPTFKGKALGTRLASHSFKSSAAGAPAVPFTALSCKKHMTRDNVLFKNRYLLGVLGSPFWKFPFSTPGLFYMGVPSGRFLFVSKAANLHYHGALTGFVFLQAIRFPRNTSHSAGDQMF